MSKQVVASIAVVLLVYLVSRRGWRDRIAGSEAFNDLLDGMASGNGPGSGDGEGQSGITFEQYQACLADVLSGGEGAGCPFQPQGPRRFFITIGDSTARKTAMAVDPDFPEFKFDVDFDPFLLYAEVVRSRVEEVDGVAVNTTVTMMSALRNYDIHKAYMLGWLEEQVAKVGMEPTVVHFAGFALHECRNFHKNPDTMYKTVLQQKFGAPYEPNFADRARKPEYGVGLEDYLRVQEPCTVRLLRYLRARYPKTLFTFRPSVRPETLFMGSPKYDSYNETSCAKRKGQWDPINWGVCQTAHEFTNRVAEQVRGLGVGILDNTGLFPSTCGSFDALHYGPDCHRTFRDWIYKAALIPIPDPRTHLDVDAVIAEGLCTNASKLAAIERIPKLGKDERRALATKAMVESIGRPRVNVGCAKYFGDLSYDPHKREYFKPTAEEVVLGYRVGTPVQPPFTGHAVPATTPEVERKVMPSEPETEVPATPTPLTPRPDGGKMERYSACVAAVLKGKDLWQLGCPRKETKDERLVVLLGDSTVQRLAYALQEGWPKFQFTTGPRNTELMTANPQVREEDGVNVTTRLVIIGTLRVFDLKEFGLEALERVQIEYGVPDLVYVSSFGLHECRRPEMTRDIVFKRFMKKKLGEEKYKLFKEAQEGPVDNRMVPYATFGVGEYVEMQRPCLLDLVRRMRQRFRSTTIVWRPFLDVEGLWSGGVAQQPLEKYCKRATVVWSKFRTDVCHDVREVHLRMLPDLRRLGVAILPNTAYFPSRCTVDDGVHLGEDCQRLIGKYIYGIEALGAPPVDEEFLAEDGTRSCSFTYFAEKVEEVKQLPPERVSLEVLDMKPRVPPVCDKIVVNK
eukprot:TRINITY_DN1270_c0_g1_i4.p1 TRINITY_DN1270_c0_g1~~TRINITY_DN1270_c0_g1_i4.p1  ORF type:complete len:852 (+),score=322.13 TRINITY_DN1270_c0_g1_i4:51-2606(+)